MGRSKGEKGERSVLSLQCTPRSLSGSDEKSKSRKQKRDSRPTPPQLYAPHQRSSLQRSKARSFLGSQVDAGDFGFGEGRCGEEVGVNEGTDLVAWVDEVEDSEKR